ncbi:TetR/AcrR family transcriptional regulator [Oceanobacillus sp. M60]
MSVKKENLLETAETLFYKYGFRGVGLKQIITEANVATMTLYNHFDSKAHLVEEVLKKREARYWSYLDSFIDSNTDNPFMAAVEAHNKWLKEYSYKGDMFMRAIEDYAGTDNNIESIARGHKEKLLHYFEELAKMQSVDNWKELAIQFTLLLEGTTSMATLIGSEEAMKYSIAMARMLVSSSS